MDNDFSKAVSLNAAAGLMVMEKTLTLKTLMSRQGNFYYQDKP